MMVGGARQPEVRTALVRAEGGNPGAPPAQQNMMAAAQPAGSMAGFQIWTPTPPPQEAHFQTYGSDFSQILEIQVVPGETVTAEPGTMLFMTPGMGLDADMGGLGQGCTRCCCAGESMFRLHLTNKTSNSIEKIALTPSFPARIVPIDLREHGGLVVNRGAFLGAVGKEWKIALERTGGLTVCCCGGQGLFLNKLHGEGMAFLNAGGTVLVKQLAPGEEVVIDKHSLLAMERTVTLGVRRTGGLMVCCCAGQGLFNAVLTGPGFVMLHSMPLAKLKASVGGAGQQSQTNGANTGGGA